MELTVILEPQDKGGYTAYVPSLPGCISQDDTKEEAIELYLEPDTNELVEHTGEQVKVIV